MFEGSFADQTLFKAVRDEIAQAMGIQDSEVLPIPTFTSKSTDGDLTMRITQYVNSVPSLESETIKAKSERISKEMADKVNAYEARTVIKSATAVSIYVNFVIKKENIYGNVLQNIAAMGEKYGSSVLETPKTVVVEHTSANPISPVHIGNLRNVMVGSHLARLLRWVGYSTREYYFVNDLGSQVGLTALGYKYVSESQEAKTLKQDHFIGRIYSVMNTLSTGCTLGIQVAELLKLAEENNAKGEELPREGFSQEQIDVVSIATSLLQRFPDLYRSLSQTFDGQDVHKLSAELNKKYEEKDPEAVKIIRKMTNTVLGGIKQTLDKYEVHHDRYDFESEISWDGTSNALLNVIAQSIFFHKQTQCNKKGVPEGAYLDLDAYLTATKAKRGKGGFNNNYPAFYLLRPDGSTLYTFRDVAYSMKKISEGDLVLNVIGSEQLLPQEKVSLTLNALGIEGRPQLHMAYELVKLFRNGKVIKMSSRKGLYVLPDDLLEDMKTQTRSMMLEKGSTRDEEEINNIAETVATASVKYSLLSTPPRNSINFDVAKAVDPNGNTGAFILYSTARIYSILQKYEDGIANGDYQPEPETIDWSLLESEQAWDIMSKYLMPFASICRRAAVPDMPEAPKLPEYGTHLVPQFAYNLACAFSNFYASTKVLTGDSSMYPKIRFCRAILQVLKNAMQLFMVEPLKSM